MAEPTEEDRGYASRIAAGLLDRESTIPELAPDLVISDVESDVELFDEQVAFLEDEDYEFPAMVVGDATIPFLFMQFGGLGQFSGLGRRPMRDYPRFLLREFYAGTYWRPRDGNEYTTLPLEKARTVFREGVISFLAARIAGLKFCRGEILESRTTMAFLSLRQRLGGAQISTPGCNFAVTTNSSGLRVFWSGAYLISSNFFSSPTTPASSTLQSGNYVFGVDGGAYGNDIQWDKKAVVRLPGKPTVHLNY